MSNTGDGDLKCEAALALPTAGAGRSLEKRRYCIDAQNFYFFVVLSLHGFLQAHFDIFIS